MLAEVAYGFSFGAFVLQFPAEVFQPLFYLGFFQTMIVAERFQPGFI